LLTLWEAESAALPEVLLIEDTTELNLMGRKTVNWKRRNSIGFIIKTEATIDLHFRRLRPYCLA
jgi:hypothetical protein